MPTENAAGALAGKTVLLVEDEYFLAEEVRTTLVKAGATVVGPFPEMPDGLARVESGEPLSGAVLDINLRDRNVFPVADALRRRGIPFVFTTGYDKAAIPAEYQDVPRCEKPIDAGQLIRLLAGA